MIDSGQVGNAKGVLMAGRVLLSAIVMPAEPSEERIDPAEIDRFSSLGLGEPATIRALADAFCTMDRDEPADRFLVAIDEILAGILGQELPIPTIAVDALEKAQGHFSASKWAIVLDEELFERRSDSKDDLLDVLDTLAHELRHAEQFFAAARFEASVDGIFHYDFLPETIRMRAELARSIEDSEEADFGAFVMKAQTNDEIKEKTKYIDDAIKSPDISADDYKYYVEVVKTKLPLERDATSIGAALHGTVEACLKPW